MSKKESKTKGTTTSSKAPESKDVFVAKSLSHKRANELRSLLMKSVKHVWVMVHTTTNPESFNVSIANEWGMTPSDDQKKLAMTLATGLESSSELDAEEVTEDQIIDISDEVTML